MLPLTLLRLAFVGIDNLLSMSVRALYESSLSECIRTAILVSLSAILTSETRCALFGSVVYLRSGILMVGCYCSWWGVVGGVRREKQMLVSELKEAQRCEQGREGLSKFTTQVTGNPHTPTLFTMSKVTKCVMLSHMHIIG
jgi:hypothetical protein